MKKKFSIIVPVYNVEKYLRECIQSVLDQDFNDYEIICVNDGSTDGSLDIILSFDDQRIKVINQENQGQSVARNVAIESSTGEYIWFLDGDDKISHGSLKLIDKITNEKNYGIIFFNAHVFFDTPDLKKKGWHDYKRSTFGEIDALTFFEKEMANKKLMVSPCCYVFKRELLNGNAFIPHIYHEDNHFIATLIFDNYSTICLSLDEELFLRRVRNDSVMTSKKSMRHIIGYSTCIDELTKYKKIKGIQNKSFDRFVNGMVLSLFSISETIKTKEAMNYVARYKKHPGLSFKDSVSINYPLIKKTYLKLKNGKVFNYLRNGIINKKSNP